MILSSNLNQSGDQAAHKKHLKQYAFTNSMGYVEKLDWLEKMSKQYDQVKCEVCGLYAIFKRRESNERSMPELQEAA